MNTTSKIKKLKPKNETFENARFLVEKYLKPELIPGLDWGREIKIGQRLLKERPQRGFWEDFELKFKLNSLAFFFTEKGQDLVSIEGVRQEQENKTTNQLDLPFDQDYPLEATNFGSNQIKQHENKPLNIIEFLDS
jgi:hypothetical protein